MPARVGKSYYADISAEDFKRIREVILKKLNEEGTTDPSTLFDWLKVINRRWREYDIKMVVWHMAADYEIKFTPGWEIELVKKETTA